MKTLGFSTETGRIVIRKDSIDAVLYSDTGAYPQWCTCPTVRELRPGAVWWRMGGEEVFELLSCMQHLVEAGR